MYQLFAAESGLMVSGNLLELVNNARRNSGEKPVRHNDFVARCEDELDGEHYDTFVVKNHNGTSTKNLKLTIDQCRLVAMRESKAVRRSVLEFLKSLESKQEFQVPTTLSGALRLAAEQAEQIEQQQALIEHQRPAVQFVDNYVQAEGLMGFRQVAKLLQANERRFKVMLQDRGVMYYLGGALTPKSEHINAGRFEVKTGTGANDHAFTQAKFTPKGVQWVAGLWAAYQMEPHE